MPNAAEYTAQLLGLLPQGAAWTRETGSKLYRLLNAVADELARLDARGQSLLTESDPRQSSELLADWERVTISKDTCGAGLDTVLARRMAVATRLAQIGGQSRAYFIDLAKSVGFDITIDEFRTFRAGMAAAGDAVYNEDQLSTWRVNAPAETISYFRVGEGVVGESLANWGNERLECTLNRVKPAHTNLLFGYGG